MNLLNLVLGLVLPIAISGYGEEYWKEHDKVESEEDWSEEEDTVDKEDDYDKSHHYYEHHGHEEHKPKEHHIIHDHVENYNKHVGGKPPAHGWENSKEEYEEHKPPTHGWYGDKEKYEEHGWDDSKDKHEEYKPPTHDWESSEKEYDKHKPPMQDWGGEEESDNGGPEKPLPKPIPTKPQQPPSPQKPQKTSGNAKPDPKGNLCQPTIDSSQRQIGQQTVADLALANSNENILSTTPKPFYRPTLQNSTSLRMCRNYYAAELLSQNAFIAVVGGDDARPKEFPHRGDSGGPLQLTSSDYVDQFASFIEVVGVTSFRGRCGVAPEVYRRVAPLWIGSRK